MANETLEQLGNALEAAQQKIGAVAEEVSEQAYNELVAIRREKLRGLQEAGNDPFELTSYPQADFAAEVKESFVDVPEGEQGRSVCMAGRMMSKRVMGKASFADLRDTTGNIQLYVRRDDVGVEEYQAFKKFDIGDIIGSYENLTKYKEQIDLFNVLDGNFSHAFGNDQFGFLDQVMPVPNGFLTPAQLYLSALQLSYLLFKSGTHRTVDISILSCDEVLHLIQFEAHLLVVFQHRHHEQFIMRIHAIIIIIMAQGRNQAYLVIKPECLF